MNSQLKGHDEETGEITQLVTTCNIITRAGIQVPAPTYMSGGCEDLLVFLVLRKQRQGIPAQGSLEQTGWVDYLKW